jgi:hypothetical protein
LTAGAFEPAQAQMAGQEMLAVSLRSSGWWRHKESGMQFFRQTKAWLYSLFDWLIRLGDSWLYAVPSISWPTGRTVVRPIARFLGDSGWLLRDLFRLSAYKATGQSWTVVFVGRDKERLMVQHLLFPDQEVEWCEIGRLAQWSLPSQSEKWLSEGVDLVICELSRIFPLSPRTAYKLSVPTLIRQVVAVPEKVETLIAGGKMLNIRNRLNRAQKNGFGYTFSRSPADYDYFYHRMYAPYIGARHKSRARIAAHDGYMRQAFHRGGLLLVTQNGRAVAGALLQTRGDTCYQVEIGVLDADDRLLIDHHVNVLTYWYNLLWASSQGARNVDFGGSRSWNSNGVLRFKAQWKARVTSFESAHNAWHVYARKLSPALQDRINKIGFITELKGGFYSVLVHPDASPPDDAALRQMLADAARQGLKGLVVLTPNRKPMIVE